MKISLKWVVWSVAYVRSLPPMTGGAAIVDLPLPARVLYGFDVIPDAAQRIIHALPPSTPIDSGVTAEHGAYVANMCTGCHGEKLSGGRIPGGPPDWPVAANITPARAARWCATRTPMPMRRCKNPAG